MAGGLIRRALTGHRALGVLGLRRWVTDRRGLAIPRCLHRRLGCPLGSAAINRPATSTL